MGINHQEPGYTDEAASIIEDNGGKAGGLMKLMEDPVLKNNVLPLQVIKPGEELKDVTVPSGDRGRYIVRASDRRDFQGLVGVIDTKIAHNENQIGTLVDQIREHARSNEVMSYARQEDPSYDGNVAIAIQPYLPITRGSIVDHPNRSGEYIVSYVKPSGRSVNDKEIQTGLYTQNGSYEDIPGGVHLDDTKVRMLATIHERVAKAGLVRDEFSFQIEFLQERAALYIAQVRVFMRKQLANFTLPGERRLVFGVTGEEGIELPVIQSPDCLDTTMQPIAFPVPWALLKTNHDKEPRLDFLAQNLQAYLVSQSFSSGITPSLEHHHYRLAQKADVTVFEGLPLHRDDFTRLVFGHHPIEVQSTRADAEMAARFGRGSVQDVYDSIFRNKAGKKIGSVKIVSDGRTATVEPVRS